MDALKVHFRPEFLNRIDEVIVFHELNRAEVLQMVDNLTRRLTQPARGPGARHRADPVGQGAAGGQGLRPARSAPARCGGRSSAWSRTRSRRCCCSSSSTPARSSSSTPRTTPTSRASSGSSSPASRASCRRPPSSWRRRPRRARTSPSPGPVPSRGDAPNRQRRIRPPFCRFDDRPRSPADLDRTVKLVRSRRYGRRPMRFSVWPSLAQPWSDVVAVATHAEATGWDGVYVADHFMGDGERAGGTITPTFEATAALAGAGPGHRPGPPRLARVRHHLPPPGRARQLGGDRRPHRPAAGCCSASAPAGRSNEHEQYGIELGRPGVRIDRFEEALRRARPGCCASR